jgi:hypothetical protein
MRIVDVSTGVLTSGFAFSSGFSNMSHKTSTGVAGLIAMPACIPFSCINWINSLGLVFCSDVASGDSAAVEEMAAS